MCAEVLHQWIEIHLAKDDSVFAPDDLIFSSTDAFHELAALILDLDGASQIQELHREVDDMDSKHRHQEDKEIAAIFLDFLHRNCIFIK